jgi:transposase
LNNNKNLDLDNCLYIGVDIHRYTHTALAVNRFEDPISEITFDNNKKGVNSFLSWTQGLGEPCKTRVIGIEGSNGYGRSVSDLLTSEYEHVYEINPILTRQRRAFGTRGDKSDLVDARLITQVLTRNLSRLPKVTAQDRSDEMVALEELVGLWSGLTCQATRLKNQLRRIFYRVDSDWSATRRKAFGNKSLSTWKKKLRTLDGSRNIASSTVAFSARAKIAELTRIKAKRESVEIKITKILDKLGSKLTTLPGVGNITAASILTSVKGIQRFSSLDKFVSYAGIAPTQRSSGKTQRFVQSKKGNRQLNRAIYTVALIQLRCIPEAKSYFLKKVSEGKTKKHALRCLMKRMAIILYGMMRSGEVYRQPIVN